MIPPEYQGREQTWLKHRVLKEYVVAWALKLASGARKVRVKLWYVDCFSGPWQAKAKDRSDTSIMIGLKAIQAARETWSNKNVTCEFGAIFVEKDPAAFAELEQVVREQAQYIDVHTMKGRFGDSVGQIQSLIGNDSAFLLVDPTGWDGAAMKFIAPLVAKPRRDVLINVMFDHINRFKDDPRTFLRQQMKDFFGLTDADLQPGLSEEELMALYRNRLQKVCRLPFIADLAVQHPTVERTKFRLVVGCHHQEGLRLFRDVERRVVVEEAPAVRSEAKERKRVERDGQPSLFPVQDLPKFTTHSQNQREEELRTVRERVLEILRNGGPTRYENIWSSVLTEHHVTERDVGDVVGSLRDESSVVVEGLKPRERRVKDEHVVGLA